jgi:DNA-binding response OmpR family regulator
MTPPPVRAVPVLKPHPKVLIVDDDPAIGRMLRQLLEGERYKVWWSRMPGTALAQAVETDRT